MNQQTTLREQQETRQFIAAMRSSRRLSPNAKHVIHMLLELEGQNGARPGQAWTTQPTIAHACGFSIPTAARMIDELDEAGCFLDVSRLYPGQALPDGTTSPGCTIFKFDFDGLAKLAPVERRETPVVLLEPSSQATLAQLRDEFDKRFKSLENQLAEANKPKEKSRLSKKESPLRRNAITGRITGPLKPGFCPPPMYDAKLAAAIVAAAAKEARRGSRVRALPFFEARREAA